MDKNTPLTFGIFEDYFTKYMDTFRGHLDNRFDDLETRLKKHVTEKIDEAIEELAYITKTGFDDMDKRFDRLENRVVHLEVDVGMLKTDMKEAKHYIQSSSLESASNRVRLQHLEAHIA